MVGYYTLGGMMFWQGEFSDALETLEKAWSVYDPSKLRAESLSAQSDPGAFALFQLGWTLWMLGYPDQAKRTSEHAVAHARRLKQPFTLTMALFWAGCVYLSCGHISQAARYEEEVRKISRDHDLRYFQTCATVLESHRLITEGLFENGLYKASQAFEEFRSQGAGLGTPWALSAPISACINLGKAEQGLTMINRAFEAIERADERQWESEMNRLKGELYLSMSPPDYQEAEARLQDAVDIARRQKAKSLELRAVTSLARLWELRGRSKAAHARLTQIYTWFSEGFNTADLVRANEALTRLTA